MDAKRRQLEEKLQFHLQQAATLAADLQAVDQGSKTPHFDEIELPAHEVGQQLSRRIQTTRAREVAADHLQEAACPDCGHRCRVETQSRPVCSLDGPIELSENVAHCLRCRRSFFPST
jgi:hypothetical protein